MPCGKEQYTEVEDPSDIAFVNKVCEDILSDQLFGFCQVDIHVSDKLMDKFSEFSPLFVVDSIPEKYVPENMKEYQNQTGRKKMEGGKNY